MTGTTTTQGYPYPLTSDFLDVQDTFRLATAIDTDLRAGQAPLRAFLGRPSFIGRSTSAGSNVTNGTAYLTNDAVEWDNTGGLTAGAISWIQPNAQGPSWWLFGADLLVAEAATPTVNDMIIAELTTSSADPVTGVYTDTVFWQRNDDSNTSGEALNVYAMASVYRSSVNVSMRVAGATAKNIASGSRLWGMYLGPVI